MVGISDGHIRQSAKDVGASGGYMRSTNREDRDATFRALAVAVFVGLLIVVSGGDAGYGVIGFVAVVAGFGGYEALRIARQIGS